MNNGGGHGVVGRQVWQNSNKALRKHGLSCARWTNEQHVVRASRCNFACMSRCTLPTHIGHVSNVMLCVLNMCVDTLLPVLFLANAANQLGKIGYRTNNTS
jgi:hypothetical protein